MFISFCNIFIDNSLDKPCGAPDQRHVFTNLSELESMFLVYRGDEAS